MNTWESARQRSLCAARGDGEGNRDRKGTEVKKLHWCSEVKMELWKVGNEGESGERGIQGSCHG